jgi:hypothetical protein
MTAATLAAAGTILSTDPGRYKGAARADDPTAPPVPRRSAFASRRGFRYHSHGRGRGPAAAAPPV